MLLFGAGLRFTSPYITNPHIMLAAYHSFDISPGVEWDYGSLRSPLALWGLSHP